MDRLEAERTLTESLTAITTVCLFEMFPTSLALVLHRELVDSVILYDDTRNLTRLNAFRANLKEISKDQKQRDKENAHNL